MTDPIKGIDVSKWQRTIDWPLVASSGIKFAYVRALYGVDPDPCTEVNVNEALKCGLDVGVYFYFLAAKPWEAQLAAAERAYKRLPPLDLPPALDLEQDSSWLDKGLLSRERLEVVADGAAMWLYGSDKLSGAKGIVYTNLNSGTILHKCTAWQSIVEFDLWVADYSQAPPRLPPGFGAYAIHQTTCFGQVPGIYGNVDLNVVNESKAIPTPIPIPIPIEIDCCLE